MQHQKPSPVPARLCQADERPAVAPPVVVLHKVDADVAERYKRAFTVLVLDDASAGSELTAAPGGPARVLPFPPQNLLAVVTSAGDDAGAAGDARNWIERQGLDVPVVQQGAGVADALRSVAQRLEAMARQNADLMLRMAELRRVHEELQNSYDGLRGFVAERGVAKPRLAFTAMPDAEGTTLAESVREVVQPLPVELRNLCGVGLHVAGDVPEFAEGQLTAEIFSPDDDLVSLQWTVPFSALRAGWITFAFEPSNGYLRRNAALRLRFGTTMGHGPLFSLGRALLRQDKAAMADGVPGSRPLAMRIWTSLPGVPLTVTNQIWPTVRLDRRTVTRIELALDADLVAHDARRLSERLDYQPVCLYAAEQRLLVHPTSTEPTIAHLPDVVPAGTREISAEIETLNPQAGVVEYALAVWPAGHLLPPDDELPEFAARLDWMHLPARIGSLLTLKLDERLADPADLLLLTRVPPGGSADFCWANFKRIGFAGDFA